MASALSGGIGMENRWSFPLVRALVDEHLVIPEDEILDAMAFAWRELHLVVEGGGAVALAALLRGHWHPPSDDRRPVVAVVSGGNVAHETLSSVLRRPAAVP